MTLNEQKYNSKTRLWFHGSDHDTIQKKNWPFVCLTSSIDYALEYTKKLAVFVCTLKAPLNIFNALSRIDQETLKKKAQAKGYDLDTEALGILAEWDWFKYKKIYRGTLVEFIQEEGYDGFANFESESMIRSNASIGIFDPDNIIIRKHLEREDLLRYRPAADAIRNHCGKAVEAIRYNALYDKKNNYRMDEDELLSISQIKNELKYFEDAHELYEMYLKFLEEDVDQETRLYEAIMLERFHRRETAPWNDERYMARYGR